VFFFFRGELSFFISRIIGGEPDGGLWGVTLPNIYESSPGAQAGMIASHPINTQENLLLVLVLVLEIPGKIEDEDEDDYGNDQPPSFVRLLVKKSNR
jgi:hypothetical protein